MLSIKAVTAVLAMALTASAAPASAPVAVPHNVTLQARDYGKATYYTPSLGACGWYSGPNDWVVAISPSHWNNGQNPCGHTIGLWYENGNVVQNVVVVDKCMGCGDQEVDLGTAVFTSLVGSTNPGWINAAWWWDS